MKKEAAKNLSRLAAKFVMLSALAITCSVPAFAATIPDNIQQIINKDFPKTTYRFDGMIILPDGTMYLPLFPAKSDETENLAIKESYPKNLK